MNQQGTGATITTSSNGSINVQIPIITIKGKSKRSPPSKRKNKKKSPNTTAAGLVVARSQFKVASASDPDPDDPKEGAGVSEEKGKKGWWWRIARLAIPFQLAIITLICAACLLEPHCCDNVNNLTMSFTPQLRYVRGPPPI